MRNQRVTTVGGTEQVEITSPQDVHYHGVIHITVETLIIFDDIEALRQILSAPQVPLNLGGSTLRYAHWWNFPR